MSALLTIDKAKLKEHLATAPKPAYVVKAFNLELEQEEQIKIGPPKVHGTKVFEDERPDTRGYVLGLRRKIEESGASLKTADQLAEEIDEMRGGGR